MKYSTIRAAAVITALLLWVVCASARQQNVRSISGTVIDAATEKPIEFATVALIAPDSTIVNGTTTDSAGHFTIERIPSGEYKLMAAFIGYTSLITDLNAVPAQGAILALEPDAEMLEEAVVTARRPVIEQKLDKLVMNISDAVSTEGSNGTDLLRKAPGVTIDFDGNVKLNGSAVAVWIDGRPSNLSGKELEVLLQSTDGTTIDRIEIMAHPSAKYDAAGGGGIINIVTKKNFMQGFNGSVNLGYGGMYFDRWDQSGDGSVNLNYRGRKTNTFLTYSARYDDMTAELLSKSLYGADNEYTMSNSSQLLMRNFNQMFRAGNDWYISDKDVLGAIVTGTFRNSSTGTYGDNFTEHLLGEDILGRLNSEITNTDDFNGVSANLNYTHTFDPAKMQELTLNADYSWYDIGNTSRQS
ncbi:MAG TPA: TonB-dependent receptor, partial [Candidatus Coprenecus merdipullorum]|nr:TonB-dependent receptor [Candidatus Coprenecus merdipullorum]